jgi:hypothetical protein
MRVRGNGAFLVGLGSGGHISSKINITILFSIT